MFVFSFPQTLTVDVLIDLMWQVACFAVRTEVKAMNVFAGQCLMCPEGQFCGSEGLLEPTGSCADGFLCLMGAEVPSPTDNRTGSLCPPGIFCQQGLKAGTWNERHLTPLNIHSSSPLSLRSILSCLFVC